MLFALRHPLALIGLLLGFVVGIVVAGWVQNRLAHRWRVGTGAERLRSTLHPARHLDPFGAVAAALGGVGWAAPVELTAYRAGNLRGKLAGVLLAAPLTHLVLGLAGVVAYAVVAPVPWNDPAAIGTAPVVVGDTGAVLDVLPLTLLGFGAANLTMGLLHAVPLPPMAAGRLLFLYGPRTAGWQKAAYHLEENNWGTGILLALSLPLFGGLAVSARITDALAHPLLLLVDALT